jgi:arylsulfatase A-like enzyme
LDEGLTTLAELFQSEGYQTAAFSNNPWIGREVNFDQGFEFFGEMWKGGRTVNRLGLVYMFDKLTKTLTDRTDHGADLTNRDIRWWFRQAADPARPFFLFINYLEPHFSYEPPEPFRERFLKEGSRSLTKKYGGLMKGFKSLPPPVQFNQEEQALLTDLYDGEIAYLDSKIAEILDLLKKRGLFENTLVVITSDHGENIGHHRLFDHQYCVYETLLHVPLILRYPKGLPSGVQISQRVSQIDLFPTLMEIFQTETPETDSMLRGESLLRFLSENPGPEEPSLILAEYEAPDKWLEKFRQRGQAVDEHYFTRNLKSLAQDSYKFIWGSNGKHELYHLGEDPVEHRNLISEYPEVAHRMEKTLQETLASLSTIDSSNTPDPMGKDLVENLRSLGYIQ